MLNKHSTSMAILARLVLDALSHPDDGQDVTPSDREAAREWFKTAGTDQDKRAIIRVAGFSPTLVASTMQWLDHYGRTGREFPGHIAAAIREFLGGIDLTQALSPTSSAKVA